MFIYSRVRLDGMSEICLCFCDRIPRRESLEDVSFRRCYEARLAVIQGEEGLRLQPLLLQGLSETSRRLQVELDEEERRQGE